MVKVSQARAAGVSAARASVGYASSGQIGVQVPPACTMLVTPIARLPSTTTSPVDRNMPGRDAESGRGPGADREERAPLVPADKALAILGELRVRRPREVDLDRLQVRRVREPPLQYARDNGVIAEVEDLLLLQDALQEKGKPATSSAGEEL